MRNNYKKHNNLYSKLLEGFTLIELLLVFSIIGLIIALGAFSFGSYNSTQQFGTSVSEFTNFLSTTRSKAISQVKPPVCSSAPLDGYKVTMNTSGRDYEQDVVCGGVSYPISKKQLTTQISFANGSANSVFFDVSTGTVSNPGSVAITGFGKTNTITIDKIGNISIVNGFSVTPMPTSLSSSTPAPTAIPPTPTPTTAQTCSKDYYWYSPYCVYVGNNYGNYCEGTCGGQASPIN